MTLMQELMSGASLGMGLSDALIKRFSPAEIRETIQSLVASEQIEMASALGDAGLSMYPHSEDILAITSLLALVNQEWATAVELITELMDIQGGNTPAFTYVMMVRALRCNLDLAAALEMAKRGLEAYPDNLELLAEKLDLDAFHNNLITGTEQKQ